MHQDICRVCKHPVGYGIAIINTLWVHSDYIGDYEGRDVSKARRGQTISRTGPHVLVNCRKCHNCGHSYISKEE